MKMLLLLSLILFQACAAKKLAVDHADTFIETSVEKRLPLTSSQKKELSKDVDKFLEQNKEVGRNVLPLIDQINLEDPSQLDDLYDKFLAHYKTIAHSFSQILAKHLARLDAYQQKKLFEKLSDENKEMKRKEAIDRAKGLESKVEKLVGNLSEGQTKFFSDNANHLQQKAEAKLERRKELQTKLKEILSQDLSTESKQNQIQELLANYQEKGVEFSRTNLPLIKQFIPSLTPKQKETFRQKMRDVKEMIGYYLEADY